MDFIKEIDSNRLPTHIAFIIDGNGRWAKKRGLLRTIGHKYGVDAVVDTINNCNELGIKYVSFFVFSTENWGRDKKEVDEIFRLLNNFITENAEKYKESNMKLVVSGDTSSLPFNLGDDLMKYVNKTQNNQGMVINICINYGSRQEILRAVNQILSEKIDFITEKDFVKYLYTKDIPDPDLIIRTSGELRLSNFMLFQSAYSELYFPKTYWPDFDKEELIKAIIDFQSRERRFGKIK